MGIILWECIMTTIVVDVKNLTVYSDSRCTIANDDTIENVLKIFDIDGAIYFGAGCRESVTTAILAIASGQEPVNYKGNFTIGWIRLRAGFPVVEVRYFIKRWYHKYFGIEVKPEKQTYYHFNSKNGCLVFGSGFEHARYAIDYLGYGPSEAIRYAASHDKGTNNVVHKLVLKRKK